MLLWNTYAKGLQLIEYCRPVHEMDYDQLTHSQTAGPLLPTSVRRACPETCVPTQIDKSDPHTLQGLISVRFRRDVIVYTRHHGDILRTQTIQSNM